MNIITVDFETYYSKALGFKTHTTEEYVRHDDFHVIGVSVAIEDDPPEWFSGTHEEIKIWFTRFDWANAAVLAHNTQFDGAILSWIFGIRPKLWLDTLCMARAVHGVEVGNSLAVLAERYNIGAKGTEVENALGLRREDFPADQLARYGEYCCNDNAITYQLFSRMMENEFPKGELKVIDITLRMFIEPTLVLNQHKLEQHLDGVIKKKEQLLEAADTNRTQIMSNRKFAELLEQLGVPPPEKVSARTGRTTYAFSKTDPGFNNLLEHEDFRVQTLVAARLGVKTTLEETRAQRFISIAQRGPLPVPIKYYAAHTGRWGGDDKINLQNLPSRGPHAGKLKKAIEAPEGYVLIDADSSQIEARIVAWLSGQTDLVEAFDNGKDVYKIMAAAIYGKGVETISKEERFVGKTTILGAGYGMGANKFQAQLKTLGVDVAVDECERIISIYRSTYEKIPALWREAQTCIEAIISNSAAAFGRVDAVQFDAREKGFLLPSGLWQRYDGLTSVIDANGKKQYEYKTRRGAIKIYGGKVVENICQALARCVIAEQMVRIAKRYKVVLTVHDAIACIAREEEAEEAQQYVETCMRWRPSWAATLPLNCESGMAKTYGDC